MRVSVATTTNEERRVSPQLSAVTAKPSEQFYTDRARSASHVGRHCGRPSRRPDVDADYGVALVPRGRRARQAGRRGPRGHRGLLRGSQANGDGPRAVPVPAAERCRGRPGDEDDHRGRWRPAAAGHPAAAGGREQGRWA